jgi:activator of HSP90 ATPase
MQISMSYKSQILRKTQDSAFTESPAEIDNRIGGSFTAWDGYIEGKTLELEPNKRIVQSWRTTTFEDSTPDSKLEVVFEDDDLGAKITLIHTNIPDGGGEEYKQGWIDFYFILPKLSIAICCVL